MRKALFLLFVSLICVLPIIADSATSSDTLDISAYKNPESETTTVANTTITVKYNGNGSARTLTGIINDPFTLIDNSTSTNVMTESGNNYTLANLFSIEIETNYYKDIKISLTFTPFSTPSGSDKLPVTYTFNNQTSSGSIRTDDSIKVYNDVVYDYYGTNYYYKYTPNLSFSDSDGTVAVSSTAGSVTETLTYSTTATRSTKKRGTYESAKVPTPSSGTALAGISSPLSASAYFGVTIAKADFEAMVANTDYLAYVTITVSTD